MLLNATYDKQWQSEVGAPADHHAALKVSVPPGSHRFVVRYRPHAFTKGLVLTTITSLAVLAFFVRERRRSRAVAARTA